MTPPCRPEIDGIRDLAVLAVLINHFNSNWLIGGFLGVDVFFVISGYVITGSLTRNLDAPKIKDHQSNLAGCYTTLTISPPKPPYNCPRS